MVLVGDQATHHVGDHRSGKSKEIQMIRIRMLRTQLLPGGLGLANAFQCFAARWGGFKPSSIFPQTTRFDSFRFDSFRSSPGT